MNSIFLNPFRENVTRSKIVTLVPSPFKIRNYTISLSTTILIRKSSLLCLPTPILYFPTSAVTKHLPYTDYRQYSWSSPKNRPRRPRAGVHV